jgi:flagellar protein FlgJ
MNAAMLNAPTLSADVYTDNKALNDLKRTARTDSPEAIRAVARQFEALFLQMMLKEARNSSIDDGMFGSEQTKMYQDMFDKQISLQLSEGQSMGLAEMLERQLLQLNGTAPVVDTESTTDTSIMQDLPPPIAAVTPKQTETGFASPQAFVEKLMPYAQASAEKLGVDPNVLIAQAALETGWGRAVNRYGDGRSSHNLFNIKADARWDGERVTVNTLEYRDGVAQRERAAFRAYDSYADSFDDYVQFLQNNPRYADALRVGHDAGQYTAALQDAGYATDPDYSAKIMRIAGDLNAGATVKLS